MVDHWSPALWPPLSTWTDEQIRRASYLRAMNAETYADLTRYLPPSDQGKAIKANLLKQPNEALSELDREMVGWLWIQHFGRSGAAKVPKVFDWELPELPALPDGDDVKGAGWLAVSIIGALALLGFAWKD